MATMTLPEGLSRPQIWSKLILRNLDDKGVMADCVNRDYEGEIKNEGDSVRIVQPGNVTINTHDDTKPIVYQDVDGEAQVLNIDQKKDWGFVIKTVDEKQSNIQWMDKYAKRAQVAITNTKDSFIHTLGYAGVAAANQLGTVEITKDNIYATLVSMFEKLSTANAIDDNGKAEDELAPWLALPPAVISVIKLSPEAKNATTLGDQTMRKGAILNYAGFDIKQTTTVKNDSGYKILGGTKEAITYADQIIKVRELEDKDYFGKFVSGLYVYGAKVTQPSALTSALFTI